MPWFSEQKARQVVIFYSLVIFVLLLTSCATAPSYRKYVGSVFDSKSSAQTEESFPNLWEKWTVYLGVATQGGRPWQLSNPFAMGGGRGGPGGEFPLQITATLMDSSLIEASLQHYATLVKMTPEEQTAYRSDYFQRYDVEDHLLIWCELRTTWAELHLDPNRWIIFIEDDEVNQYEPMRVLEESQSSREMGIERLPGFQPEQRRPRWKIHRKTLMFCFPKQNLLKNPILSERVRFLKLVFQLSEDETTRAEGVWVFKK